MDSYLTLKLIHVLSAVILAGTGLGIAYFMHMAHRSGDPRAIAVTARHVVLADWIFTTPAIISQLLSGLLLMQELHYSWLSIWFIVVFGLFIFIGTCWVPVVFIQYRLRNLSADGKTIPDSNTEFRKLMRIWRVLGILAFSAILIMFWLMIFKPFPVQ